MKKSVSEIAQMHQNKQTQLLAILHDIQEQERFISDEVLHILSDELDVPLVELEGVRSFYHFFSSQHRGRYTVYMNTSATSEMSGAFEVMQAFEKHSGIEFGQTTSDFKIGLYKTSCIGLCDQEPAAIINNLVFTQLTASRVKEIVEAMKAGKDLKVLLRQGEGQNKNPLIGAEIFNNIRQKGPLFFNEFEPGSALKKAMDLGSLDVIESIKKSNLRGRGGAGFPTGQKWGFCRAADANRRYVICNIDEGEPGTFKDRVLLTENPYLVFEGMVVAGYAIESKRGIVYLRGEYAYLKNYLEEVLNQMRQGHLLGKKILGTRFSFDIQIKLGAGAYICGEESALIESAEGKRGQPRNRPPFPVVSGYLNKPTVVNNPETFGCAAKIVLNGPEWFRKMGTAASSGVKLFSVAGDCDRPGIYELEWGMSVADLLKLCGAKDAYAVQVGGPSGVLISERQFARKLAYEDLGTGGAITIFNKTRDLLSILHNHMEFFNNETCGFCVPCRAGNAILLKKLEKIMIGNGTSNDLSEIKAWGQTVKLASRCGLGQTSPNPLLTALQNFSDEIASKVRHDIDYISQFNMDFAIEESVKVAGRSPNLRVEEVED
ncbi:MAG: NAD(P)H-dependent oxidoreductase subunit E [Bdellovibrionaceae bacterium]|nr:NAD(P)H-dependent oxidoreductase subunit E [Pseudobdellovibrionaceae bacterium]